ncbi:hypothetical protein [Xanthomonas campestris]|nr:hypothetical protein [Xanthomonas campestris]
MSLIRAGDCFAGALDIPSSADAVQIREFQLFNTRTGAAAR